MPFVPTARLCLLALVPFGLGIGMVGTQALLLPMLAADLVVVLLAALDALLASGRLVTVEREPPRVLSVGRANPVRLTLRSTAGRPLQVSVTDDHSDGLGSDELPARVTVPARGRASLVYHVRPTRRGAATLGDHHLRYRSPLGLWQRQLRQRAQHSVRVYPDVATVREYELLARQSRENLMVRAVRLRGGENEFERLRDYGRDDEYRNIDWKATARRGRLIVREYQQERNQTVVCLLDCGRLMTAEGDQISQLDHALNATLMMAHVAARAGDQVGLLAFDARVRAFLPPAGGRKAVHRVVQATYDLHPSLVESDFEVAFAHLSRRLRKRALVVLFTQVIDDVAARGVLKLVRGLPPRHLPLVVLFRDAELDRLAELREQPGVGAGLPDSELYVAAAAAEAVTWRERLVRDLRAGGALTLHVPARQLTPAVVNRYLTIKAQHLL
jgi:uncharacterized protein (DUF58 family)